MSFSSTLNSAISGLNAARRAAELVSENIANAQTPGYARRSLSLTSNSITGGVHINGITRHADPGITANRRQSDSIFGAANARSSFHSQLESLIGTVTDPGSISQRIVNFESSLIQASSRPESPQRLDAAVAEASGLAQKIAQAAEGVRSLRTRADTAIDVQVNRLNQALQDVQAINSRLSSVSSGASQHAGLLDQRQKLVDEINKIVPVNVVARDRGMIALYTDGGAILLDGPAATVGFTPARDTVPGMTLANGLLSGLEINGVPVRTGSTNGAMRGGTLSAQFEIRDELAVSAQSDLDAVARDLIERFETPGLDATVAPGDPGLFTDDGIAFSAADELGLAGRITVNALVDSSQGGESWRLRDGLGAGVPGLPGDASQLQAFTNILTERRTPGSTVFGTGDLTMAGLGSALLSRVSQQSGQAEQRLSFAAASLTELNRIELDLGVDIDAELQALLVIEQAYAANARMIEVADEMMQAILRI
ncbi:MAG: flagellar hook-associated protein FlgK [Rhodobacteraceae bacterium]|nr:flagellar hook-associated protein FlgK [Paracoccaceae bacterium]